MKITSFISEKGKLIPVEVELTLWPGLPTVQFLGLADQHLKESALRIKSAIKHQGFQFPKAQQILVNLRPSHLKKTSRGLELAVAAAYLWETKQAAKPIINSNFFVYGELSLSGEVYEPEDLPIIGNESHWVVMTGKSEKLSAKKFRRQRLNSLRDILTPEEIPIEKNIFKYQAPNLPDLMVSKDQARILAVSAMGEHSMLIAGPAGSGKTTLAKALHSLLLQPAESEWEEILQVQKIFGNNTHMRPFIKPHHTTPVMSMIGGGSTPLAGEISRAHGGLMLLDEFLEFHPQVQEALREPFEEGVIRVARCGQVQEFPARSLIVATTNLCPCGDFVPGVKNDFSCRFSRTRCQSYSQKLSGPLLDRFQLLVFSSALKDLKITLQSILEQLQDVQKFIQQSQGAHGAQGERKKAARMSATEIEKDIDSFTRKELIKVPGSERRRLATLRVARTLADLEYSREVRATHIEEASYWSSKNFEKMKRWDLG